MSTVFLLGAGASRGYDRSASGVRPPLANGFFQAYGELPISEDFNVRVGSIVNHVRDTYGLDPVAFGSFDQDIEQFMTHLDLQLRYLATLIARTPKPPAAVLERFSQANKAFDETMFLAAHILNEAQNGPNSEAYARLVSASDPSDVFITFNWDTLLDRVLMDTSEWSVDHGYGVEFEAVLDGTWREPRGEGRPGRRLLKLHGSTNWLINYVSRRIDTGERMMVSNRPRPGRRGFTLEYNFRFEQGVLTAAPKVIEQVRGMIPIPLPPELDSRPVCILDSTARVPTNQDRWRPGYAPLSYFFPPDHPRTMVPLMPLMIAPTSFKLYEEFSHVFDPLWTAAAQAIEHATRIVVIGYSFPATDTRSLDFFRGLDRDRAIQVEIVNPDPKPVIERLLKLTDLPAESVHGRAATFEQYL